MIYTKNPCCSILHKLFLISRTIIAVKVIISPKLQFRVGYVVGWEFPKDAITGIIKSFREIVKTFLTSETTWKVSVFGVILARIFPHSNWITPNTDTFYAVRYYVMQFFHIFSLLQLSKWWFHWSLQKYYQESRKYLRSSVLQQ